MVTKKHLSRRTFLHGVGATIALPYLDAMTPAFASTAIPVTRAAFVYTANGIIMKDWTPAETGNSFSLSKTSGYIDPASIGVVIAMIVGAFVGAGMTLRVYWLKIKHKLFSKK